ncbi:MAG TPA: hypothetical protein VEL11_01695 [Candidatus Bathyarchaeia archaeon]|nr:hypothetical protein [Candidatus Bathyarchaeia archaeon]
MTVASLTLEEFTTNSFGDCGGTCCAKDIWKPFIKIRKYNKTTTDNVLRIVHGLEEKINSRIQQNNLYPIFEMLHNN